MVVPRDGGAAQPAKVLVAHGARNVVTALHLLYTHATPRAGARLRQEVGRLRQRLLRLGAKVLGKALHQQLRVLDGHLHAPRVHDHALAVIVAVSNEHRRRACLQHAVRRLCQLYKRLQPLLHPPQRAGGQGRHLVLPNQARRQLAIFISPAYWHPRDGCLQRVLPRVLPLRVHLCPGT